jgi:hypothetical protein
MAERALSQPAQAEIVTSWPAECCAATAAA